MSSKVSIQWLIPSLTANTRSWWCCGFWALPWAPGVPLPTAAPAHTAHTFGRGESWAVPWLHLSSGSSKAHLTLTVLPTLLLPGWAQGAGSLSVPPLALTEAGHQQPAFVPILAVGQGRQSVTATARWLQRHCEWNGLLLYLAQISLFESIILSSSGITISTDNINRNSSSLLQPTPFPSIPCANRRRRVNALYSCDLAVVYIYPGLYTAASQSPLRHYDKQVFSSTVQMRRTGMAGTALGSRGGQRAEYGSFLILQGDKSIIRFEWSSWHLWHPLCNMPLKEMGLHFHVSSETSSSPFPCGAPQSHALPYFLHSVFGVCVEYALRQRVKHGLLSTMCSLTSPVLCHVAGNPFSQLSVSTP